MLVSIGTPARDNPAIRERAVNITYSVPGEPENTPSRTRVRRAEHLEEEEEEEEELFNSCMCMRRGVAPRDDGLFRARIERYDSVREVRFSGAGDTAADVSRDARLRKQMQGVLARAFLTGDERPYRPYCAAGAVSLVGLLGDRVISFLTYLPVRDMLALDPRPETRELLRGLPEKHRDSALYLFDVAGVPECRNKLAPLLDELAARRSDATAFFLHVVDPERAPDECAAELKDMYIKRFGFRPHKEFVPGGIYERMNLHQLWRPVDRENAFTFSRCARR